MKVTIWYNKKAFSKIWKIRDFIHTYYPYILKGRDEAPFPPKTLHAPSSFLYYHQDNSCFTPSLRNNFDLYFLLLKTYTNKDTTRRPDYKQPYLMILSFHPPTTALLLWHTWSSLQQLFWSIFWFCLGMGLGLNLMPLNIPNWIWTGTISYLSYLQPLFYLSTLINCTFPAGQRLLLTSNFTAFFIMPHQFFL